MKAAGLLLSLSLSFAPATALAQVEDPGPSKNIQPAKSSYGPIVPLDIWFDCYLDTGLDCALLEKAFFEADRMTRPARSAKQSDVIIKLRDWQIPPLEQYEATFTNTSGRVTSFTIGKEAMQIRATLTTIGKIQAIVPHLVQGVLPSHQVIDMQYNPVGQLQITFANPTNESASAPPPWYIQAGVGGMAIFQGPSVNSFVSANLLTGYTQASPTNPNWLVEYGLQAKFNFVSAVVTVGDQTARQTASNLAYANGLIIAKSLTPHWSVATFIRENRDPSANYATQTQLHGGIEYELLPYLASNDNTFTINYLVGGNYQTYVFPNKDGQLAQAVATHAASLYYVYHAHAFDVSGSVGVTTNLPDVTKWGVGAQLQTRIYFTRSLFLDLTTNIGYKNNLIQAPATTDPSYQLLTLMGVGGAVQQMTWVTRANLTYIFGGTLIRQKDTRWQFTSDQVPNNF